MMQKTLKVVLLLMALLLMNSASAEPFVGFKFSTPDVESSVTEPTNLAIIFGNSLDTWVADLSLVGEFSYSIDQGKTRQGQTLELNSGAVYVLWKTTRSMFVTLRGGLVGNEVVTESDKDFNSGLLLGGSIGQVIGRTRLQIDYTRLGTDADYYGISLEFDL